MTDRPFRRPRKRTPVRWIGVAIAGVLAAVGLGALRVRGTQHEPEATPAVVPVVGVGEDDTDAATWGARWPLQYERYLRTAMKTATTYRGHGGSEAMARGEARARSVAEQNGSAWESKSRTGNARPQPTRAPAMTTRCCPDRSYPFVPVDPR